MSMWKDNCAAYVFSLCYFADLSLVIIFFYYISLIFSRSTDIADVIIVCRKKKIMNFLCKSSYILKDSLKLV